MTESKETRWVCARCGRRKGIDLESDPSVIRVCAECSIENYCRPVKGVVDSSEKPSEEDVKATIKMIEAGTGIEVPEVPLDSSEDGSDTTTEAENLTPENTTAEPEKPLDKMTKAELLKELERRG